MSELRAKICEIGRLMHQFGLIDGSAGNISARLDDGHILMTPSGVAKGFMQPEQLIVVNLEGEQVDDNPMRPTSEMPMHLEAYRQRPDVGGVVHAHPPHAVALTVVGISMATCIIPEAIVFLGLVPTAPYSTPSSTENRDAISELITEHDAILLAHHGSLTVAKDVWSAYLRLESLEHTAKILHLAHQTGRKMASLPPEQVEKLFQTRRQLGLERPGDVARFRDLCGLSKHRHRYETDEDIEDKHLPG